MRLLTIGACLSVISLAVAASPAGAVTNNHARVRVSGQLVVTFHGDRAAGCEASFRCDVESGSIRWTPPTRGQINLLRSRRGKALFSVLNLYGFGESSVGTLAIVERRAADGTQRLCADARGSSFDALPVFASGRRAVRFGLWPGLGPFPTQPLPTNCGGPLPADVLRTLPSRTVSLRRLLRGPTNIDLSGSAEFAAGGLAGRAESTIEVTVGRLVARRQRRGRRPRRVRRRPPFRSVQVEYRVAGMSGSLPVDVLADPRTCAPLDACGLAGSLTLTPRPAEGEAYLSAYGRVPKSALRRALGLAPGPAPPKVTVFGYVELGRGAGTVAAALDRDGAPACRDVVPFGRATLELRVRDGNVRARFAGGYQGGVASDPLRTRCPGPLVGDLGRATHLATGDVPLRAFARRKLTLRLDRGASVTTPGFTLRSRPDLTLELEREID